MRIEVHKAISGARPALEDEVGLDVVGAGHLVKKVEVGEIPGTA